MAIINSKKSLQDYCLRRLGAPVIQINVDDEQISDRIDEALQIYGEFHCNGVETAYLEITITATDVQNKYVTIPNDIISVKRLVKSSFLGARQNIFSFGSVFANTVVAGSQSGTPYSGFGGTNPPSGIGLTNNLLHYDILNEYVRTFEFMFRDQNAIEFKRHTNRVQIFTNWESELPVGSKIMFETTRVLDPNINTDIWNDLWLKKYCVQLIKQQWGSNLIKYGGLNLVGGLQFSGEKIFDDANQELEKLDEELRLTWELPLDIEIG